MTKTIILTGASDGIGAAAASSLVAAGHKVVAVGRSPEKTRTIGDRLGIETHVADFAELDQVEALASALLASCDRIDVLANNAGGSFGDERIETVDGHELTFQVNYLAPWYLTRLLLPRLIESGGLIINTSSQAHHLGRLKLTQPLEQGSYRTMGSYANSKLAQVMHTVELQRRFGPRGVSAVAFHPGTIASNFGAAHDNAVGRFYQVAGRFLAGPDRGADTLVWLANGTPGIHYAPGRYYVDRSPARMHRLAHDLVPTGLLWHQTEVLLADRIQRAASLSETRPT